MKNRKSENKTISTEISLDGDVYLRMKKIAELSGTSLNTVASVILALQIVKTENLRKESRRRVATKKSVKA